VLSIVATAYASTPATGIGKVPLPNLDLTFYAIDAVAEDPSRVTKAELKQMLQSLLEERFKAQVHSTTRELDGYVLSVAQSGIKFKETSGNEQRADGSPSLRGKYRMEDVVNKLKFLLGRVPIVDKTGLEGLYDMTFAVEEISAAPALSGAESQLPIRPAEREFSPPIPKAFEDQLGLHLERAQIPVEILVVDHLELPKEN
jgi:uncharacterized protein (TIGR03435 family)